MLMFLAGFQCSSALAQGDALEEAATPSALVPRSLLLDIERVGNKLVAVGERGHIMLSNDQAASWTQALVPVRSTLTSSFFVDEQQGWVVGHDGVVLHSRDGGLNWTKQLDGHEANRLMRDHGQVLLTKIESVLATMTEQHEQLEAMQLKLEDLTIAVEDSESFLSEGASRPFLDIWFKNSREGFIVGAFGLILRTNDGGDHWTPWFDKLDNPDAFHLNAIQHIGDALYIAAEAGDIFRSDDWGQSWLRLESPYEGTFFGVVEAGEGNLIAYGLRGNAFISADKGASWAAIDTGTDAGLFGGARLAGGAVVLVGAGGTVLQLSSQGKLIQRSRSPYKLPLSAVLDNDADILTVGFGGVQSLILKKKQNGARP
ncbi:WD40/YVTN/BNR-like repeat-containing protein [Amphritea japonica]|nr:YCF48-related protein [Amphritea japonica]